ARFDDFELDYTEESNAPKARSTRDSSAAPRPRFPRKPSGGHTDFSCVEFLPCFDHLPGADGVRGRPQRPRSPAPCGHGCINTGTARRNTFASNRCLQAVAALEQARPARAQHTKPDADQQLTLTPEIPD